MVRLGVVVLLPAVCAIIAPLESGPACQNWLDYITIRIAVRRRSRLGDSHRRSIAMMRSLKCTSEAKVTYRESRVERRSSPTSLIAMA